MVFELFKGHGDSQLELIESQVQEMLADCGRTFDLAMQALVGEEPAESLGKELRKTDRRVNRAERAIRRELIVHAGVRMTATDIPLILIYMSIIKDIERIGDYSKNIWDMAAAGADFSKLPERGKASDHAARTTALIADTARAFRERDAGAASELLPEVDQWLDEYDAIVIRELGSDRPSREGVPVALYYRYLKRITAHLMNVLTAVVMPVDRLDYWDEDKADRW